MRTAIVLPLAVLSLAACATNAGPEPAAQPVTMRVGTNAGNITVRGTSVTPVNVSDIAAPTARVWQTLPSVYQTLRVPVTTLATDQMLIGNYRTKVRRELGAARLSTYINCGSGSGGQNADSYDVTLALLTQVTSGPAASSKVITTVEASAVSAAFGGSPVPCVSTGELETRIADMIRERLR